MSSFSIATFPVRGHIFAFSCLLLASTVVADESTPTPKTLEYNRDIRPILIDKCFACHGADSATREAGLRLDVRDEAISMEAIVPGDLENSELVARIRLAADVDGVMPPKESHKELTEIERKSLEQWISEGAEYEAHWSFLAPTEPAPPEVQNKAWVRNPIDQFILQRLETEGLTPAPEADRWTLARRAALDLTGLPPDPVLLNEFIADESHDAYERYLDRLFSLATWGEHRARYWLDYARYADTHGIHFDNYREMWSYRDWVIAAFNRNQPYDQFSIEQLAGDLLPEPSLDQTIATGFNRCNMTTNEGGIIDDEYKVLYARDRTETTSAVWLGLTTGCAVCHDHKFDPLTMKDFYAMSAFFNNTTQPVRDGNVPNTPPVIVVPQLEERQRWFELVEWVPEAAGEVSRILEATKKDLHQIAVTPHQVASLLPQQDKLVFHAPLGEGTGQTVNALVNGQLIPVTSAGPIEWKDGHTQPKSFSPTKETRLDVREAGDYDQKEPFTVAAWVYPEKRGLTGAVVARMNESEDFRGWDLWLDAGRIASHVIHKWPDQAIKVIANKELPVNQWSHVALVHDGLGSPSSLKLYVDGVEQTERSIAADTLKDETTRTTAPLSIGRRNNSSHVEGLRINDVRLYSGAIAGSELVQLQQSSAAVFVASLDVKQLTPQQTETLARWHLENRSEPYREAKSKHEALVKEQEAIRSRGTIAHVMAEKPEPAMAHILNRGEYDQQLEQVTADVPGSLPPLGDRPRNRLGLAQWLFSDEHPLTARVTVNRFWQEVFGTGLVRTSADFGITGELPSHPELLDYLAVEFRETGWDVRQLFRWMLASSTYRQSAKTSEAALSVDPENRLLSRGPRYRMDGEMIRDVALWSSGLLSPQVGGPSVRPYQPEGVWEAVAMPGSNTRDYKRDEGAALYRRSMYTFWKRAAPPASMEIFGAPSREVCTVRRERTNTPLQALVTLNDPQFVEASRKLAERTLIAKGPDRTARLQFIAQYLLSRQLIGAELEVLLNAASELETHFSQDQEAATALLSIGAATRDESLSSTELAAWTLVASEVLNLDETLCK